MPVDPIYKHIGERIKARRKKLGRKQEHLASEMGISRGSLANIEIGRQRILVHQLYRFASALNLTPFDLLPQPTKDYQGSERTQLPVPGDLKERQKIQVTQFYSQDDTKQSLEPENNHVKSSKR